MSKVTGVVQLVNALEAERDALAAQVELLRKLWNAAQPDIIRLFEIQPIFGDNEREIDGQSCHELQKAFAATPQQCLLDVHIERDAMIAQNKELSRLLVAAEKQTDQLTLLALGELSLNEIKADAVLCAVGACEFTQQIVVDSDSVSYPTVAVCLSEDLTQYAESLRQGGE